MMTLALSELLGATVYDPSGASGRVREVTLTPQEDRSRISGLIVKTKIREPHSLPGGDCRD